MNRSRASAANEKGEIEMNEKPKGSDGATDHMNTPWRLTFDDGGPNSPALRDASGHIIADCYDLTRAKRIVASVNACADIAIEQFDLDIAAGGERALFASLEATVAETVKQRDDLRDALHVALPFVEDHEGSECYKPGAVAKALRTIRAAIANIESPIAAITQSKGAEA